MCWPAHSLADLQPVQNQRATSNKRIKVLLAHYPTSNPTRRSGPPTHKEQQLAGASKVACEHAEVENHLAVQVLADIPGRHTDLLAEQQVLLMPFKSD